MYLWYHVVLFSCTVQLVGRMSIENSASLLCQKINEAIICPLNLHV